MIPQQIATSAFSHDFLTNNNLPTKSIHDAETKYTHRHMHSSNVPSPLASHPHPNVPKINSSGSHLCIYIPAAIFSVTKVSAKDATALLWLHSSKSSSEM